MDLKGTQTEQNLMTAFSGESMARNRYTFFAEEARRENREDIAKLFEEMERNETIHGRIFYNALHGKTGSVTDNLNDAMNCEYEEWTSLYPDFAKKARAEGFPEIAEMFDRIASIEKNHEQTFLLALAALTSADQKQAEQESCCRTVTVQGYRCTACGAVYETPMEVCTLCEAIGMFEPVQIQTQMK